MSENSSSKQLPPPGLQPGTSQDINAFKPALQDTRKRRRGKRKRPIKRARTQPTTNKFWSQIGKNEVNLTLIEPEVNDLTEDNSPANPMEELSKKNLATTSAATTTASTESQESTIQNPAAASIVKAPKIYYMKTEQQLKEEKEKEKTDAKAVVAGRAADIKLVIQNKSKAVKLQPTPKPKPKPKPTAPVNFRSAKTIKPRVTSGPQAPTPEPKKKAQPVAPQPPPPGTLRTPLRFPHQILQQFVQPIHQPLTLQIQPPPQTKPNLKLLTKATPEPKTMKQSKPDPPYQPAGQTLPFPFGFAYPKGIPKSFLHRPETETSEQTPPTPAGTWQPISSSWQPVPPEAPTFDKADLQTAADAPPTFPNDKERDAYSPTAVYDEQFFTGGPDDPDSQESSDAQTGQKRQSAFERLGPLQEQPKKPKLTINLLCNSDQSVREVVNETEEQEQEKHTPVHLRQDIVTSTDETVMKYLIFWPWKKKFIIRKTVTNRQSKSTMILEREQMEEYYERNYQFFKVSVTGYPPSWTKEMVLDALLDTLKGKSFIPCFIEFTKNECNFLVLRCRLALVGIHKNNFFIRKDGVEMTLCIALVDLSLSQIDFVPRTVLKNRLIMAYKDEKLLDLSSFTLQEDVSHFIYYPLNQVTNQIDIRHMMSVVQWGTLVELNLSHNRLTTIEGFKLGEATPKLKHLDLSFNYLENTAMLIPLRALSLRTLKLEGNPLCLDFIDPDYYIKVLKTNFSMLQEIDGVKIPIKGELRPSIRHYCPKDAQALIDHFLGVFFPLLDGSEKRNGIQHMYYKNAKLTITYRYKLRYDSTYRSFKTLFNRSRVLEDGDMDSTNSDLEIANLISKWPPTQHDPASFTVDVLMHHENTTIFKVTGIMRLKADSLIDDEPILSFSRTFVLHSRDTIEYKIHNEMLYWDMPTTECIKNSFKITTVVKPNLSVVLESPPDEYLKENLIMIFMELTKLNKKASERCLGDKNWNLKTALDCFIQMKLDDLDTLFEEIEK